MIQLDVERRAIVPGRVEGEDEGDEEASRLDQRIHLTSPVHAIRRRDGNEESDGEGGGGFQHTSIILSLSSLGSEYNFEC